MNIQENPNSNDKLKVSSKELEECNLKEARFLKIKDRIYDCSFPNPTFSKKYLGDTLIGADVRMEFDRWSEFDLKDFDLLGISCWKKKQYSPVVFEATVQAHTTREIDNHGMTYDVVDSCCVILPNSFSPGQTVKVTIQQLDSSDTYNCSKENDQLNKIREQIVVDALSTPEGKIALAKTMNG